MKTKEQAKIYTRQLATALLAFDFYHGEEAAGIGWGEIKEFAKANDPEETERMIRTLTKVVRDMI